MKDSIQSWTKVACMSITIVSAIVASAGAIAGVTEKQNLPEVKYESGVLPKVWFSGGPACATFTDDFQVNKYNDNFYILRQSGCTHTEKPFLYILFGKNKAILFDTGAGNNTDPTTGRLPNVVGAVDKVINEWLVKNNRASIPLVVTHLHSHWDHTWGDPQFEKRPNTTFVKPGDVGTLQSFFGIKNWPQDIATFDLGGRILDIIPIPGHDATSIAVYDRATAVLLTGDTVYPGRIYINEPDPDLFQASVQRLVDFTSTRLVVHVLGTHIEQRAPYLDYAIGEHYTPEEIPLELGRAELLELLEASKLRTDVGGKKQVTQKAYRDFTICDVYPKCTPVNSAPRK